MKTILPLLFVLLFAAATGRVHGEAPLKVPDDAMALAAKLTDKVSPAVHTWIVLEGSSIAKNANASENTVRADIQSRFSGQALGPADVDTLTFMVLMEAIQRIDSLSKNEREAPGDIPDAQSVRAQVALERRPQFVETIVFLMKKIGGTESTVLPGLK